MGVDGSHKDMRQHFVTWDLVLSETESCSWFLSLFFIYFLFPAIEVCLGELIPTFARCEEQNARGDFHLLCLSTICLFSLTGW